MRIFDLIDPEEQAREERRKSSINHLLEEVYSTVKEILDRVRSDGDKAVIEFTRKFDRVNIMDLGIKVRKEEIEKAYNLVDPDFTRIIEKCIERLEIVEREFLKFLQVEIHDPKGVRIKHIVRPLDSVGCYIPGGRASYPSTVTMTCVPAKVAGVKRLVICTPPRRDGTINPAILVTADIVGVDEIYRIGGAQAIAAMAYGTESIKKVRKIVGPGGIYVSVAKMLVSSEVLTDCFAGPSELLILADSSADPELIALDLISQAEHDPLAIVGLVTTSRGLALTVFQFIERFLKKNLERREIIEKSLERSFIARGEIEDCIRFINEFAPEHLQIMVTDSEDIVQKIENAGIILVGENTPTALSDYCLGTNHVLPTAATAKYYSRLSVLDFIKVMEVAKASEKYIREYGPLVKKLAELEQLPNHAKAIEKRLVR